MKNYRHVLKRFKVDRLENESYEDFLARVEELSKTGVKELRDSLGVKIAGYLSSIDSQTEGEIRGHYFRPKAISLVVELYEIPQIINLENMTLRLYHDDIYKVVSEFPLQDEISDINIEDVQIAIVNQINLLNQYLVTIGSLDKE